jgi:hypothetical protein
MTATHPNLVWVQVFPEFVEGPFFLFEATVHPHTGKRVVVWAIDETTARHVFAFRANMPTTYCVASHIGDLEALRNTLKLSQAQFADLQRDGYVRL